MKRQPEDNVEVAEAKGAKLDRQLFLEEEFERLRKDKEEMAKQKVEMAKQKEEMAKQKEEMAKKDEVMAKQKEEMAKKDEEMAKQKEEMAKQIKKEADSLKWNTLLNWMKDFIQQNLSTTVRSSPGITGKSRQIHSLTYDVFLESCGITLLDPLSPEMWHEFCLKMTAKLDDDLSEKKGVHPIVLQIVEKAIAMLPNRLYQAHYEQSVVDDEHIAKKPDISITLVDGAHVTMTSVVVPIEIKLKSNVHDAINQSLGYLMVKLRDQLELSQNLTSKLFGYCFGTDGHSICLGKIEVEDYVAKVSAFDGNMIPFWCPESRCETEGIRLLRTLLALPPDELGHTFPRRTLTGQSFGRAAVTFDLTAVLGRGGFATAFEAVVVGSSDSSSVVIKAATLSTTQSDRKHYDQLKHMTKELDVLKQLHHMVWMSGSTTSSSSTAIATSSLDHFPSPLFTNWECTEQQPFLPMTPVGVPLVLHASNFDKTQRRELGVLLKQQLLYALAIAHQTGFCHCDLRPDNVIFNPLSNTYIIIDWGLGCPPEAPFHGYLGGLPFFHDDIVKSAANMSLSTLLYRPEYDVASAEYVVYAFILGMKQLSVPWVHLHSDALIDKRAVSINTFE